MKIRLIISLALFVIIKVSFSQKLEPQIICYASDKVENTSVTSHSKFARSEDLVPLSTFEVEYTGFTTEAQTAFQRAVDIWASIIKSDVPIRISATWELLDAGVLGSAGANGSFRNFEGAPEKDIDYPVALAEKLARRELNSSFASDINANFSSGIDWYLGTDGLPAAGQYDLVTVVMHEIGHGLGIAGSFGANVATQIADHALFTGFNRVYDTYLFIGSNSVIDRDIYTDQSSIYAATTSGSVTFNSAIAKSRNESTFPPVFAPSPYNPGSSISHLDEASYPAGDPNSLMTPQVGQEEAIHVPGDVLMGMMIDMGWEYAYFDHEKLADSEDVSSAIDINIDFTADMNIVNQSLKLFYTVDNGAVQEIVFANTQDNSYTAAIPNPGASDIEYYFQVEDEYGRTISTASNPNNINIGTDITPPEVEHTQVTEFRKINKTELPVFEVSFSDNLGVSTAVMEYSLNDGSVQTIDLLTEVAQIPLDIQQLNFGDIVQYRIVVTDASNAQNTTNLPANGFYDLLIIDAILGNYETAFDDNGRTFSSSYFNVESLSGFDNAFHSPHPYANSSGDAEEHYLTFIGDVIIDDKFIYLTYDDIALIEPGIEGSSFGISAFKDFISIEGSTDEGVTWSPLSGYDATFDSEWLSAYQSEIIGGESQQSGTVNLFVTHQIQLSSFFETNSIVKLRFKMKVDNSGNGWGWALNNFKIERFDSPLSAEENKGYIIYPNPTAQFLNIHQHEQFDGLRIVDTNGRTVQAGKTKEQLNVSGLDKGIYILQLIKGQKILTQKFYKK